jgi:cell wall-associated NlpC family hydrolase
LTLQLYQAVARVALPRTAAQQFLVGHAVSLDELRPGDLVFFSESGKGVSHVGVSLGRDRFVHASVQRGVILSSLKELYYSARACGARRLLGR